MTVAPTADTLLIDSTTVLTATIVDAAGSPVAEPVVWATLNSGIASVAITGARTARVTAEGPGTTRVSAGFRGSADTATIVVSAPPTVQLVVSGLSLPLYVTQPPADTSRLFVVEQPGRIRVIRNGTPLATPFLDISDRLTAVGDEQGLLSVAFHPNYATNGYFYVDYTDTNGDTRIERYTVNAADSNVAVVTSAKLILSIDQPYENHNGGLVLFGPDGKLYIGMGDGGSGGDPQNRAQNPDSLLGKLLRIDVDAGDPYAVPPDNPFVAGGGRAEIWALGLRNPWRFSFDRVTGDLYIADVGQNSREEVNFQPATSAGGENYGWNIMEGTICYPPPTASCNQTGLVSPVFDYVTHTEGTCSITGGYVYRGTRLPILAGHYFYADYCAGWVRSFRYVNGAVPPVIDHHDYTPEFDGLGLITSFGEDSRGQLYIVTRGGSVYRIVPAVP